MRGAQRRGNPAEPSGVTQIAAGDAHSLFLKSDGSLYAMGWNNYGLLGDGTTTQRTSPVQVVDSGVVRLPEVPGNLSFGPGGNSSSGGGTSSSGGGGSSSGGGLYPVPYAGKVAVNGENFSGVAKFTFSIVEANGTTHWINGADADEIIEVPVTVGRYLVLLGGQGMNTLPTDLFLTHTELYLKVMVDLSDGQGLRHLAPDQRITSTPHALSAEVARRLLPGTVTLEMLAPDARTKVEANATIPPAAITPDMLSPDTLAKFDQPIPRNRLPQDVLADLTRTITRNDLSQDVLTDLNRTITRDKLAQDVLADLNRTITRDKLSQDLRDDLNATITRNRLAPDVLTDLNRTITRENLAQDVLADLNRTVGKPDLDDLILKYLSPEITAQPLSQTVYTDGNVTFQVSAEGKYVSYQWQKNGVDLDGKTSPTLVLTDVYPSPHEGNYTIEVSNEFGSVTSSVADLAVEDPLHVVQGASNLEMIWLESGTFTMGSPSNEGNRGSDETQHQVSLTKGFYLGKYEVTQAQYQAVMTGNSNGLSATPSQWPNNPNRPVDKVSWNDVQVFLTRLNAAEKEADRLPFGWAYVLPTEAEWEYACRAGTTTAYFWGNGASGSKANQLGSGFNGTRDVGLYAPNPWGFFDMHGNVWEWTLDKYQAAYPTGAVTDPTGPATGANQVLRGGSWFNNGHVLRSARRTSVAPDLRKKNWDGDLGFRLAFKSVVSHTVQSASNLEMLWVEPGVFTMGSPTTEAGRDADRENEHNVTLTKGFYLGKYEVTQAQYQAVMTGNSNGLSPTPSQWPNNPYRPVEKVSWNDVQVFLTRVNATEQAAGRLPAGWSYILPTESEWEYACRAGTTTMYSWGDSITAANANYDHGADQNQTVDVGQFSANPLGFFDMHGNVWEWVSDWYQAAYPSGSVTNPTGPASGSIRGKRGGSWFKPGPTLRSAKRATGPLGDRGSNLGFRLALKFVGAHTVQSASNLQMIWVEPGTFTMGSPTTETGRSSSEIEHIATLTKGFFLGKYEVTQAQYQVVMTGNSNGLSTTPSQYSGNDNRPVEKVSWNDVQVFLTRLNAAEQAAGRLPAGWSYVLPTEAEWEYTCRAGTTTTYSWGNSITNANANWNMSIGQTCDVGQYAANPWGFYDMHGNVFEWTADWFDAYPEGASFDPATDPTGPSTGTKKSERGGSFWLTGNIALPRSAKRIYNGKTTNRYNNLGFRLGFKKDQ